MPIEKIRPAFHFTEERVEQLKQIVPEAFADGKINWESLQEALGEFLEEAEPGAEHFGLFWPGKKAARKIASIPSKGTLIPSPGEGVDEENSRNIFIEGENLEVLKLLQKSYANRIKMIYIDPPYNTGNDFIYDDNFTENKDEYLKRTGQLDEDANPLTANRKSDGRFHSKWLSMMDPRLRLSRNLMCDDGLIFINIDHNENYHLRALMNEIFGEENFLADVIWKHTMQSKNDERFFSRQYNNLLIYSKSFELQRLRFPRTDENNKNYSNPDNDPKGFWRSGDVRSPNFRKTLRYYIKTPSGKKIAPPEKGWRWSEEEVLKKVSTGEIIFSEDESKIVRKIYLADQEGRTPENVWIGDEYGTTRIANAELKELFDGEVFFDTPKPTSLIMKIIDLLFEEKDYIIMDFFAGSGTTGHAVYKKNLMDNGKRQFICVQLDEKVNEKLPEKTRFKTISSFSIQRLRKVCKKLTKENKQASIDIGFRLFKLEKSNFKSWGNYEGANVNELENLFAENTTPLISDWVLKDLLNEIILIEGFSLDSKSELLQHYKKNEVTMITSDFCEHKLLVCLDKRIYADTIKSLQLNDEDIFICLDSAITDQDKITLQDKGLIKTI